MANCVFCAALPKVFRRWMNLQNILLLLWIQCSLLFTAGLVKMVEFRCIIYSIILHLRYRILSRKIYFCNGWCSFIQELLERHNVPFVGTGSRECRTAFDKVRETVYQSVISYQVWKPLELNRSSYVLCIEYLKLVGVSGGMMKGELYQQIVAGISKNQFLLASMLLADCSQVDIITDRCLGNKLRSKIVTPPYFIYP